MPNMKVHRSGGIVFTPTREEQQIIDMKKELGKELEEAKKLKAELLSIMEELKEGK